MRRALSQIKWAVDLASGELLQADRADHRPGKGRYRCPDPACSRDLTVARSKNGRQHFRHFRNGHAENCAFYKSGGPQTLHTAAKTLLLFQFSQGLAFRTPMPILTFDTTTGRKLVLPFFTPGAVKSEWTCPRSGRRADLAVLDALGQPALLIEVWNTSPVREEKADDISRNFWIEVGAQDVLADPSILKVRNWGNLPSALALVGEQLKLFQGASPL